MKEELPVLYEFAMTPDLFDASVANSDGSASIILVELLRGIAENGLLANLHKDRWLRHVTEKRATTLSPALKDKVLTCLSVLHDRHRLVRHPKCMAGVEAGGEGSDRGNPWRGFRPQRPALS